MVFFQLKCRVRYDSDKVFVSVCLYFEREMSIQVKFSFEGEF